MLKKFLELFKKRVLPALPEEYDKIYYVDSSTVKTAILHRSGYKIFHQPYFAMKNSTHGIWQLNPHKKTGVDAAETNAASIPFSEYLKLFEKTGNE